MSTDRFAVLRAWLAARWSGWSLRTPADVERQQARLWRAMASIVARTEAVSALAGRPLPDFPIMEPNTLREDFDAWNTLCLTRAEAEAAALAGEAGGSDEVRPGVVAGFSSGSSGRPGLFVTSAAERAGWVGHILARLLPADALLRPTRIALCLRADNRLYGDVAAAGPFRFLFVGLDVPGPERFARLRAFTPDVLIAPSQVLADLARRTDPPWPLRRLFYGAEPMGEAERGWIAAALGVRPDPIYQATEGFLGAPCRLGTLHLNEDVLIIEREPVPGTNRFLPIVTDLRRTTQPMIRVRLPDLLEPLAAPCPCGSPLTAVHPVEGRLEDLWRWPGAVICPRTAESAVSAALGPGLDWRALATPRGVKVEADPEGIEAAQSALQTLLAEHGVDVPVTAGGRPVPDGVKRRRVRWSDG
ncbi:cell division protein FtsA [Brevundimonas sp.]|uniref:cell division protein FtsA n=1 Tax=Brevundimonas sp. TaxID=1871086 RepID=UPI00272F62FF|nr:cell division protein FtsA [Brevundimonas sp.]MDP1913477.1 cell division protein FtsA [Brevundimonas sp.]